ncbi:MAG: macro domain-containing protein [Propionibacteriaceae bacterium]|nr:macro domain-containing protein [Propionibacteriaceae bacterium]
MRVEVRYGDIVCEVADAIVNAANSSLLGGGGVDGAIHAAAGPALLAECRRLRQTLPQGLPVGQAVATGAGQLHCRWVIHTVGPNAHRGQTDPALMESCFRSCLRLARELGAASAAFPAVSAGAYGWAVGDVAAAAARVLAEPEAAGGSLEVVRFVLSNQTAKAAFEAAFRSFEGFAASA